MVLYLRNSVDLPNARLFAQTRPKSSKGYCKTVLEFSVANKNQEVDESQLNGSYL